MTDAEAATILCHDAGHFETGTFYRVDSPYARRDRAERKATTAAIRKYVPYEALVNCLKHDMQLWEIAEYLGFTERFILDAYLYYKETKGLSFG